MRVLSYRATALRANGELIIAGARTCAREDTEQELVTEFRRAMKAQDEHRCVIRYYRNSVSPGARGTALSACNVDAN